ncbi:hypothetical protein J6590_090407 [Homalodisca vitripennis]|nr:hypothetical protein J6590_090407 [Homalodisca vitripennis]
MTALHTDAIRLAAFEGPDWSGLEVAAVENSVHTASRVQSAKMRLFAALFFTLCSQLIVLEAAGKR